MRHCAIIGLAVLSIMGVACRSSQTPTTPSPALSAVRGDTTDTSAATGLKTTIPALVQPIGRVRTDTLKPTLEWQNARGTYVNVTFSYELEFYRDNNLLNTISVDQASGDRTTFTISDTLAYDTLYRWRVRGYYGGLFTDYSATGDFVTPLAPVVVPTPSPNPPPGPGGPSGPERNIPESEALALIRNYHDRSGANLGSSSTRESRIAFWVAAVAIVHFGHASYNSAGGDRNWCIKDAGGGRPISDDVIARCNSRDAWDLIGGAGANGYGFHLDYLGRLPSDQNIYPPPASALPK